MDRRAFLQRGCALAAATWWVPVRAGATGPRAGSAFAVPARFDEVDRHDLVHALRDGRAPLTREPTEHCEVAIVGGGIAGLVTAHRLGARDLRIFEKEPETGGNSRARDIGGARIALGAFLSQGPIAPFTDYFAELDAQFVPVAHAQQALWSAGRSVADPLGAGLGALPWTGAEQRALARAVERLRSLLLASPPIGFPREDNAPQVRALDRLTLWDDYAVAQLPARVRALFDALVGARVGDAGEHLSAWYGNYLLANVLADSYTMPGGHGDFARRLAQRVRAHGEQRVRTGFTALRVENRGAEEVWVSGIDADGAPRTIAARCAVVCTPKHFVPHLVPEVRAARAQAWPVFRTNAYLVAQVRTRRRLDGAFETVVPDGALVRTIVAHDALPGNACSDGGGVLTAYAPFPRAAGRAELLGADAQALAQRVLDDVLRVRPEAAGEIGEITLHRWGHPMMTAAPGIAPELDAARAPVGRIVFAHSDNLGITGLYSAVWAGMEAHAEVEVLLS